MTSRARKGNYSYLAISPRSPYSRRCPRCSAYIGERCWKMNTGKDGIAQRINSPHAERKLKRPKEE